MIPDYEPYTQYYETDQMGCVHHSNYIRWMEEARVDFLPKWGGITQSWNHWASFRLLPPWTANI